MLDRLGKRALHAVLRIARQALAPAASPLVPSELLVGCKLCSSREDLAAQMPRRGRVALIGCWRGDFAKHVLGVSDPNELHLADYNLSRLSRDVTTEPRVTLHLGAGPDVLAAFKDASFDWIFLETASPYEDAARDAETAAEKLKPGGYLIIGAFVHGAHRAVTEFATTRQWPFAWWAYDPRSLYSVALRRPF